MRMREPECETCLDVGEVIKNVATGQISPALFWHSAGGEITTEEGVVQLRVLVPCPECEGEKEEERDEQTTGYPHLD